MLCRRFVAKFKGRRYNSRTTKKKRPNHQPTKSERLKRRTKGKLKCRKTYKNGVIWDRDTPELFSFYSNPPTNCWRGTNWKNRQGNKKAGHFEPSRPKFIRRTLPWAFRSVRVRTLRDAVEVTSSFWYVTQNQKNLKFKRPNISTFFYLNRKRNSVQVAKNSAASVQGTSFFTFAEPLREEVADNSSIDA